MSSKKVSTKQKVKNGILGFVSGATSGGATGAVVAIGGCFVGGCALFALGPIAAGAGVGAIASQAITGGVALTTLYGAPAAVGAGALSAGAGGIGGAIKGSKCKSKKEALLKSAKIGAGCGAVIGGASIIAVGAVAAASAGGAPGGGVRYEKDNDGDITLKDVKLKDVKVEDIKIGTLKIKDSKEKKWSHFEIGYNDTRYMKLVKDLKSKSIAKDDLESILDGKYQIKALKQASANKTADETAIWLYTSPFIYSDLARSLIKDNDIKVAKYEKVIVGINKYISDNPLSKETVVYHGHKNTWDTIANKWPNVGETLRSCNFISTSTKKSVASSPIFHTSKDAPLLKIIIPSHSKYASSIEHLSYYPSESEILISPFAAYKVMKKTKKEIVLKMVDNENDIKWAHKEFPIVVALAPPADKKKNFSVNLA